MRFPLARFPVFLLLFFVAGTAYAQGPLEATEKFFASGSQPADYSLELLSQTEQKAIVAAAVNQPEGRTWDVYFYLENNGGWEIRDVRSLAMTRMLEYVKEELEKLTPRQVDSIIKAPNTEQERIFETYGDYAYELGHIRLTLASDAEIIRHFRTYEPEFTELKDLFLEATNPLDKPVKVLGLDSHLRPLLRDLYLQSVEAEAGTSPPVIRFVIGGVIDNYVGYLYVSDPKNLPAMSADSYIAIRPIGNGWYLFKTT